MADMTGTGRGRRGPASYTGPMTESSTTPKETGITGWLSRTARASRAAETVQCSVAVYDTGIPSTMRSRTDWDEVSTVSNSNSMVHDAIRFAEHRLVEAAAIARELGHRADMVGAPEEVQSFLLRSWALVMAQARLVEGPHNIAEADLLDVVTDLLWSVRRDDTLRQPARLFEMIPGLLQRLRNGLSLLGEDPRDSTPFFNALEALHRPVLKLCAVKRHEGLQHTAGVAPDRVHEIDAGAVIESLRAGAWVTLYTGRQWVRAQLAWVSHNDSLFMFTGQSGRAHSMTRRILERLVRERLLRPLDRVDSAR
jgi:hypothetical protein